MKKFLKENCGEIIIISIFIIFAIVIGIYIKKHPEKFDKPEITEQQLHCEHEFVVTSEYCFWSKTNYRVVSKCIKCGYVER